MTNTILGWTILVVTTVAFAALKLTGQISWSWLWVFAPLWGPWVLSVVVAVALIPVELIIIAVRDIREE